MEKNQIQKLYAMQKEKADKMRKDYMNFKNALSQRTWKAMSDVMFDIDDFVVEVERERIEVSQIIGIDKGSMEVTIYMQRRFKEETIIPEISWCTTGRYANSTEKGRASLAYLSLLGELAKNYEVLVPIWLAAEAALYEQYVIMRQELELEEQLEKELVAADEKENKEKYFSFAKNGECIPKEGFVGSLWTVEKTFKFKYANRRHAWHNFHKGDVVHIKSVERVSPRSMKKEVRFDYIAYYTQLGVTADGDAALGRERKTNVINRTADLNAFMSHFGTVLSEGAEYKPADES